MSTDNHQRSKSSSEAGGELIEYRVQGLSCPNCTREMQEEIQKLDHGNNARLSYNSGKLTLSPHVNLNRVETILKSDGARIVHAPQTALSAAGAALHAPSSHSHGSAQGQDEEHGHDHGQAHEHRNGSEGKMKWLLSISAVFYVLTFLLEGKVAGPVVIALYAGAMILSGYTTFLRGLRNLTRFKFNMDTLMTVALVGAVIIGEWREATLVAILFGLNELLEGYGMNRARQSMEALLAAAPKEADLWKDGQTQRVPIESLSPGDVVRVRPGEKIPSDGAITQGTGSVNEAAITGESVPVTKREGDTVFGGSVSTDGVLYIAISKAYEDSSLAKIMHLVQEAQDSKTPTELFIDKFAKYYTPAIMIIALAVTLIPPLLLNQPWMTWIYQGLSILIVGCPCSLVLSSPIALVSGMTRAARNGILIKGGVHLEQLGRLEAIAFDKTGTLTKGEPAVYAETVYDETKFYAVVGALEQSSLHPLAKAVMKHLEIKNPQCMFNEPQQITVLPGEGIRAEIGGKLFWVGSEEVLQHVNGPQDHISSVEEDIRRMKAQGYTIVAAVSEDRVLGQFGLADEIRPETATVVSKLHEAGITDTVMLTGDHEQSAQAIAKQSGVSRVFASLLPEQKVAKIKELSSRKKTGMVGDGINDAPALAAADLGIAMGKGTDSAIETADVVLMQDHLGKLPGAIQTARRVNQIIKWNIGLSLSLKAIALLLTIPGWLTLWIAIISDMGATIIVTMLGLTILLGKDQDLKSGY
ncbi:heavy metal translocating P-type ATPase [Paenibacillus lautus]|uniref:heavy metal translocating P-type ATPase n=1 Tax=Paenibacillus lautus TaxID=1401 RepID=UPI000FDBAE6F|nr:heavy metal translocating P-type ATPase [Paenibacillus lautus]